MIVYQRVHDLNDPLVMAEMVDIRISGYQWICMMNGLCVIDGLSNRWTALTYSRWIISYNLCSLILKHSPSPQIVTR